MEPNCSGKTVVAWGLAIILSAGCASPRNPSGTAPSDKKASNTAQQRADDSGNNKLSAAELPKAVLRGVQKKIPDGEIISSGEPQDEDGELIYSVLVKTAEGNVVVNASPTGKIMGTKKKLDPNSLPPAIQKGISELHPGKKVVAAAFIEKPYKKTFLPLYSVSVETEAGKKPVKVALNTFGRLAKAEEGGKEKVPADMIPKDITDAINVQYSGAQLKDAVRSLSKDDIVYKIPFSQGGKNYSISIKPLSIVKVVDLDKAAAEKAAKKKKDNP